MAPCAVHTHVKTTRPCAGFEFLVPAEGDFDFVTYRAPLTPPDNADPSRRRSVTGAEHPVPFEAGALFTGPGDAFNEADVPRFERLCCFLNRF